MALFAQEQCAVSVSVDLTETLISSDKLLNGNFLNVKKDTVRLPNGRKATREYVVHPGAVVLIPLLDNGDVVLERQFRYPIGQVMIEFPAGKLDPDEDTLLCGLRELYEETGYRAAEWAYAGPIHLAIAYSTEILHAYFLRGLTEGERALDEDEFLEVFTAPVPQFLQWCSDGTVTDAKTLSCALHLSQLASGQRQLRWQSVPSMARPAGAAS